MSIYQPDGEDIAGAIEREVEAQANAAKHAIREYKRAICREPVSATEHFERQREVRARSADTFNCAEDSTNFTQKRVQPGEPGDLVVRT